MKIHKHTEKWDFHSKDVYILIDENHFLGHVYVDNLGDCHVIVGLFVLPPFRGYDYGKQLINEILTNDTYTLDIWLMVNKEHTKLINWYESQGFEYNKEADETFNWMKYKK